MLIETECFFTCAFSAYESKNILVRKMEREWEDWDVSRDASVPVAPDFMFDSDSAHRSGGKPGEYLRESRERVQEEWNQFIELLNSGGLGEGYSRLRALRDNMEERWKNIVEEEQTWADRGHALSIAESAHCSKLLDFAGVEQDCRTSKPLQNQEEIVTPFADQPILDAFLDFDDEGKSNLSDLQEGWKLKSGILRQSADGDESFQVFKNDRRDDPLRREHAVIRYSIPESKLGETKIDPDNLPPSWEALETKPSTTWREAITQIREQAEEARDKRNRSRRTRRVVEFRAKILNNVLYRFEMFGDTEKISEQDVESSAKEKLPDVFEEGTQPLKYAESIVDKYRNGSDALPEKMGEFQERWVPTDGRAQGPSKVKMIQRQIPDDLSDRYNDPDSFCQLIWELLEVHLEAQDSGGITADRVIERDGMF
ncbi:hypothetical protein GGP96_003220 [Salinibacter ruber]|uniref:hypothetical protein n=1 Tax=Salinibacter ruber TaxID=146919 RepID=UPI00216800CD|nr:hypothetical protein [Salinibacter ruber]MCS4178473.1 hypothetical protein [Salinibacter ruber]